MAHPRQAPPQAPYVLVFTERYLRIAARFLKRHPDMTRPYEKTLALLEVNPHHPSLRLHSLGGRLTGIHSVAINLSYRVTLQLLVGEREIVPLNVGDHVTVY